MMKRRCVLAVFLGAVTTCVSVWGGEPAASPGVRGAGAALFTSQDATTGALTGWKFFAETPGTKPGDVWKLESGGVLRCRGTPKGYLATEKDYTDFTLRLEWRWPAGKPGNGGVLLRKTGPDKIWPKSLEAQINAGQAGDFWGLDGFRLSGPAEQSKSLTHPQFGQLTNVAKAATMEKPAGQWNRYEIVARGGVVTLSINGREVNQATGCDAVPGKICLTAEGDEYYFRNVEIIAGER